MSPLRRRRVPARLLLIPRVDSRARRPRRVGGPLPSLGASTSRSRNSMRKKRKVMGMNRRSGSTLRTRSSRLLQRVSKCMDRIHRLHTLSPKSCQRRWEGLELQVRFRSRPKLCSSSQSRMPIPASRSTPTPMQMQTRRARRRTANKNDPLVTRLPARRLQRGGAERQSSRRDQGANRSRPARLICLKRPKRPAPIHLLPRPSP